jgi:hypothetical protein
MASALVLTISVQDVVKVPTGLEADTKKVLKGRETTEDGAPYSGTKGLAVGTAPNLGADCAAFEVGSP